MKILEKLKDNYRDKNKRKKYFLFPLFLFFSIFFAIFAKQFEPYLTKFIGVVLIIELTICLFLFWFAVGRIVMESLFIIGAELTLIIYLTQTYCDIVPESVRTANEAAKSLLIFGLIYLGWRFIFAIYEELLKASDSFKKDKDKKISVVAFFLLAFLTGLFVWQIWQVLYLIVGNLCIFK